VDDGRLSFLNVVQASLSQIDAQFEIRSLNIVGAAISVNTYLKQIKQCILAGLGDEDVSIALFGSMARGTTRAGSDVDVAVIPHGKWDSRKMVYLREKLEELNVPYKVELIDFSYVSEDFRNLALKNTVWWKRKEGDA